MTLEQILEKARQAPTQRLAVAAAEDGDVLSAVCQAARMSLVEPVLIGDEQAIRAIAREAGLSLEGCQLLHEPDHRQAAERAVALAKAGQVQAIMKGQLHSSVLMKAILNKETGIRSRSVLSHVGIIQCPKFDRLLFLTDGAMCTYPDLEQKVAILQNAVELAHRMGVQMPKVACLSAVETVNPKMQPTLDAAALALMNQRGQITGCLVDGPLALDNALSMEAVKHKKVLSPVEVRGNADILLVPSIESGNMLLKASRYLADCQTVGLVTGAKVPVIMCSRADTAANKLLAIACAVYQG